jgi:hypothetical protein
MDKREHLRIFHGHRCNERTKALYKEHENGKQNADR